MTKLLSLTIIAIALISAPSCKNAEEETTSTDTVVTETVVTTQASNYISLSNGTPVRKDEATGKYVDESGNPVEFYVDMSSMDTFYAANNQVVNNALIHEGDIWKLDDAKVKIDGDEMKIKTDDTKIKVDGDETKIKTGDTKIKTDGDEYKRK